MSSNDLLSFDGVLIDTRPGAEFGKGHIPNSINIGLEGQFAPWAGTLIAIGTPVAIVAETMETVDEAFVRLARVGIETVQGYILFKDYSGDVNTIDQVSVESARDATSDQTVQFVDVRRAGEHAAGHARNVMNLPLDTLAKEVGKLDPKRAVYVLCQSGYRSSLATSILENAGFSEIYNVTGGTQAWMDAGFDTDVSETACASSSSK